MTIPFDNSYARLPERFYAKLSPTPVSGPERIEINHALAAELGLGVAWLESDEGVAMLAGNHVPPGADSLAQAYAGHQFGGFVPQLGDGRAILLGEVIDRSGERRDIQLKGSGPTPFSRGGDGRAWLGPVLREYLLSEAMHALGVPTTRALAAVTTGERVYREDVVPGAIITRVAQSHVRVGTFQFFAARQDKEALKTLFDYVVERHYAGVGTPLELVQAALERQAVLVAKWLGVGFIHGVMNTDNAAVAGETIDYGPCAFLDEYHPLKVYSSIDRNGRYAYGRQSEIAIWNMAQLASALIPLIDDDEGKAVAAATEVFDEAGAVMQVAWLAEFRRKLGLVAVEGEAQDELAQADIRLIHGLLKVMYEAQADFTNTFRALPDAATAKTHFGKPSQDVAQALSDWVDEWAERLRMQRDEPGGVRERLQATNPILIPRNHRVEQAIQGGLAGDFSVFQRLLAACTRPFEERAEDEDLRKPPKPDEVVTQTFCGT